MRSSSSSGVAAVLFFLLASPSQGLGPGRSPLPYFGYELKIAPESYSLDIHMSFSPDVSFGQVIEALRNGALLHEFNPDADPIRRVDIQGDQYDSIMSWKAFGIRTAQLSHCAEKSGAGLWSRRCDVDIAKLDAGKYTAWKWDEVTCREGDGLACDFRIQGKIKNFLFMKSSVLTLKAKRQALINWGRFWYLMESAGASTRLSNPIFDGSELKHDIEALLASNIGDAKARPETFRLERRGAFSGATTR